MSLKRRVILGAGCGVMALLLLLTLLESNFRIPSDEYFKTFFESHRKGFESLKEMLSSEPDEILGVTRDEVILVNLWKQVTPDEAGMSKGKFDAYQALMKVNNVRKIWRYDGEIMISAGFWGWGFASMGPRFTYVYRESTPFTAVSTLDARGCDLKNQTVYLAISKNWYVRLTW